MRLPILLNADLTENRRISPVAMTLTLNRVPLSTASIQLTEEEEIPPGAMVEIFIPKGSAGVFRTRTPDNNYGDRITTIELEHAIAEVGNSIVTEKLEEEMALDVAMARLFGHYKGDMWQMAQISYTDTVTVDVDYENILEAINRLIKQTPYMMVFDFSTTPWTFGLAQTDESVTAEGRLSRNVMSGSIKYDDSNIATRAYAAYDNGESQEVLIYEDDAAAIAQYGIIEKKLNDVYANETKARAAAIKHLQSYNRPKVSISITGEELSHITGEMLDAFEPGKRMRFVFDADETPIDEIIDSVRYEDLVADENGVTVSMAEEDDYEYVLNELKDSDKRTRKSINRINDEIHRDLWSSDGRLHSQLDLTASHLRTYFEDTAEGYWSEIEQTASYWRSVYADAQNNLGIIEQTASYWRSTYTDAQNNLGIIEQTASYWRSTYADAQNNLGVIEQTASYWRSVYSDAQNNLGEIEQTASYWRSTYQDANSLMGQIEQTASYWRGTYTDTVNSLRSEVQQTASYWRTQLVNEGTNQRSSIVQTAASLTFTADQIYLDGDTKISDILGINSSGFLTVDGDIYQTGTIYPGGVTINRGGDLKMWTGGATGDIGSQVSLTGMDVNDMIVKADVSGNTLTLWKRGADLSASSGNRIINFSKATTLSPSWSSGAFPLTVNATQINNGVTTNVGAKTIGFTNAADVYLTVEKNGDPTAFGNSKKLINVPFKIVHHAGGTVGDQNRYASSLASVDATSVYNNGWDDVVLNDPVWGTKPNEDNTTASNSLIVSASDKTNGTARSKSIPISLTVDTTNKKAKVSAGGYVRAIESINMKTNAEYNTAVANAGYAGRAAVTISSSYSWGTTPSSSISVSQNSVTLSTTGRTNSSGTVSNDTKTINFYTDVDYSGSSADFYVTHTNSNSGNRIIKRSKSIPHSVASFDTTAKYGYTDGTRTNNKGSGNVGYYISGSGSNATVGMVVKGVWTCDGVTREAYNYLEGAPTAVYLKGYSDGESSGSSISGFDTTAASTSETYNGLTNNSDGYTLNGTSGVDAHAYIVTKSTWSGNSSGSLSYLRDAPTALYRYAFLEGWKNYYDDPDWWEAPSSSNGYKCYIPNRNRSGKVLWFTTSSGSSGPSNHTSFYITVTQDSSGKHVKCEVTYPLSSNVPSFFSNHNGGTGTLYWN